MVGMGVMVWVLGVIRMSNVVVVVAMVVRMMLSIMRRMMNVVREGMKIVIPHFLFIITQQVMA